MKKNRNLCLLAFPILLLTTKLPLPDTIRLQDMDSPAGLGSAEPHLAGSGDGVYLSWLEKMPSGGYALKLSRWDGERWSERHTVHASERIFSNWADFPSIMVLSDGSLVAHWLEKAGGSYEYDVWIAQSRDGGKSWSKPERPHRDGTLSEHGFVSLVNRGSGRFSAVWLDGRNFAGEDATHEMALMFTTFDNGTFQHETELDRRVCDCCQTAAAATRDGIFVAYRDRSESEVRDISYVLYDNGQWTSPRTLYPDGWEIPACPVNGPAVSARGDEVVVAWFTSIEGEGRVRVMFSRDGGKTFGEPVQVDEGDPNGRVNVEWLEDGAALVSWQERVAGKLADLRVRRVSRDRVAGSSLVVATTSSVRATGFPRLTRWGNDVLVAWTESEQAEGSNPTRKTAATRVRVARIEIGS